MYLCQGLFLILSTRQLFPSLCAASGSVLGPLLFSGSVRDFSHMSLIQSVCWQLTFIPPAWTSLLYSTHVSLPIQHLHSDVASQTQPLKLTSYSP